MASGTLTLAQWNELLAHIGALPAPKVAAKPTSAAIRDPRAAAESQRPGSKLAQLAPRAGSGGSTGRLLPGWGRFATRGAGSLPRGGAPAPPAPAPRRNAARKALWHLASAALNWALLVSMPLVSNTGPLPEVFGAGTFTPFSRRQLANLASAAWKAGLLKRAPPRAPPAKLPPPHFFSAASYCARVTPFGS